MFAMPEWGSLLLSMLVSVPGIIVVAAIALICLILLIANRKNMSAGAKLGLTIIFICVIVLQVFLYLIYTQYGFFANLAP
jgi:uncharacterized membrane protein